MKILIIKKLIFLFAAVTTLFYSCQENKNNSDVPQVIHRVDTVIVHDTIILYQKKGEKFMDQNRFRSYVFDTLCIIYSNPDTMSQHLGSFDFKQEIRETYKHYTTDTVKTKNRPEGYYLNVKEVRNWRRIKYGEVYGYVETKKLADRFLTYYKDRKIHLILANKVNNNRYSIMLKLTDGNKLLDTLTFSHLSHGYELSMIDHNGLNNTDIVIKYRTYRESCPGGESTEYIALKDNKFTFIVSGYAGGEEGEFDESTIYFPLKPLENDKIFHVPEGNFMQFFNWSTGKLMNYEIPETIPFPHNELIVTTRRYTSYIMDENGEEKYNEENGTFEVNVIEEKPVFYHWNGTESIKVE